MDSKIFKYISKIIGYIIKLKVEELGRKVVFYSRGSIILGVITSILTLYMILYVSKSFFTVFLMLLLIILTVIFFTIGFSIRKLTNTEYWNNYIENKK